MDSYYEAENSVGYSEAFDEYRQTIFRDNFLLVTFLIVAVIILLVKFVGMLKHRSDTILERIIHKKDSV